jgi:hypothetical protein
VAKGEQDNESDDLSDPHGILRNIDIVIEFLLIAIYKINLSFLTIIFDIQTFLLSYVS